MRFLADESCDFVVVRALRATGHDVLAVAQVLRSAIDADVISYADRERRILLTEGKDFGQLFYAGPTVGRTVILMRFPQQVRSTLGQVVANLITLHGDRIVGTFVVVQPGRIRISRKP